MNLKEQRESLVKGVDAIVAKAKAEDRDLTTEEAEQVQTALAEVKDVDARLKAAAAAEGILTGDTPEQMVEAKNLGEAYVSSGAYEAAKQGRLGERFGFKAATDVHTLAELGSIHDSTKDLGVLPVKKQPTIFDWIKPQAINESGVKWVEEGLAEGSFKVVPEKGQKPQLHFTYTPKSDTLHTIAAYFDSTVQLVRNETTFAARINDRGLLKLEVDKANLALNATKSVDGFDGLLSTSGLSVATAATAADWLDTLADAIATSESLGDFPVDGILINSKDWAKIRRLKDGQGAYLAGSPFGAFSTRSLFEIPVIVAPYLPEGTAIVGQSQHADWYQEPTVWVETTNSDQDKFTKNILTTRIEQDGLLTVTRPSAFVKVTLTAG